MRQTKYVMSGGLAFSEEKDMEKLRQLSLKGWHVRDFKFMGYSLEKGERSDYIYSLDYRFLKEDEEEEYVDFFASAGWQRVASEADLHLFRATSATKPIYTDRDTTIKKYKNSSNSLSGFIIPLVLITALIWIGAMFSSGVFQSIFLVLAIILCIIAIPAALTIIATYHNKWKIQERRGLVNLVRILPILLLVVVVVTSLFYRVTESTAKILLSMLIGGVALPTAIWVIMSFYHKVRGLRG